MQISKSGQILDLSNDSKREEKIPCLIVVELNSCFQKKKKKKKKANTHTPPISLDLCFGGLTGPFFLNFGFGKIRSCFLDSNVLCFSVTPGGILLLGTFYLGVLSY